jgi:hypothetical protein
MTATLGSGATGLVRCAKSLRRTGQEVAGKDAAAQAANSHASGADAEATEATTAS